MKKVMLVLLICSLSYALNAPYLISATALSDSSVSLSWRNNDVGTTGFIVQRKDSTETGYHFVDSVKSAAQLTYTDIKGLLPVTLYTYQVIAYSATEVSDTSNSVQVTTLALSPVFNQPTVSVYWNYDTSASVRIQILDNSNCEVGYRIYREQGFSSSFSLVSQITSTNPVSMDAIIWNDSAVTFNTWYNYKVAAYTNTDSIFSLPCSTYTFQAVKLHQGVKFTKLSDFPVSDSGSWSAKAGDSIILKENPPAPAGMFSVINVSNPVNPSFAGYIDSATARSYPLQTMIPIFMNFGIYNSYIKTKVIISLDRMLVLSGTLLRMYLIQGTNLVSIDSEIIAAGNQENRIYLLNDTLLAVLYFKPTEDMNYNEYDTIFFNSIHLSSSGFSSSPNNLIGTAYYRYFGMPKEYLRPYIQGSFDNKIIIPIDACSVGYGMYYVPGTPWSYLYIMDNILNRTTVLPNTTPNTPYANAYNTGYYIFPAENLCTNAFNIYSSPVGAPTPNDTATELFVSYVGDPHPYSTAQANNAIYRDDIHRQNALQNILLDTLKKQVFLIFKNNMTILGYQSTGVVYYPKTTLSANKVTILRGPMAFSITIVLSTHSRSSDLYFYDLSGRVVDKMLGVTSNAVLWRPKTKTMSCYIVQVRNGGEKYTAKFMVR
jgi:hypothetical protein